MSYRSFLDGRVTLHDGDCREIIATLADDSIDSVCTDPPYHLQSIHKRFAKTPRNEKTERYAVGAYGRHARGFMGKMWDGGGIAFDLDLWADIYRVLKPGGHVIAFGGTRTYHRLACAIEDVGFEIRDQIGWLFGSGFPKSHNVSKAIDRTLGAERKKVATGPAVARMIPGADQNRRGWVKDDGRDYVPGIELPGSPEAEAWQGWGTALKPAHEPIVLARKPLIGTVAANVLAHGTGGLNIDGCRVPAGGGGDRWPANLVHDGSDEVLAVFQDTPGQQGDVAGDEPSEPLGTNTYGKMVGRVPATRRGDDGSAARFFYHAKADADDRIGSRHPTVKPVDLMRWLVRLVTPPGGTVLDPFAGTGTTAEAAFYEGFDTILIEREAEYLPDIERRMQIAMAGPEERRRIVAALTANPDPGPLFAAIEKDTA